MKIKSPTMCRMIKRGTDLFVSLFGLIILSPILAILYVFVRTTMGKPVLFRQLRAGLDKEHFTLVKFRTMRDAIGSDGKSLPDGDRLTRTGIILRKTSLDELPELWNVIKGELSLVGPRPMPLHYLPFFKIEEEMRFSVLPGITGWAQIHGRNEASWTERFARDVWYVENWSIGLDLMILFKTILHVMIGKGIEVDPRSVMLNLDEERRQMVKKI